MSDFWGYPGADRLACVLISILSVWVLCLARLFVKQR